MVTQPVGISHKYKITIYATQSLHHKIYIKIDTLSLPLTNAGVLIDDQLTISDHVASRSCCFALHQAIPNTVCHRAAGTSHADLMHRLLQYSSNRQSSVGNAAACLVFNQLKQSHSTPLLIELHWLSAAAHIKFHLS